jgi:hypothetical protein
MDGDNTLPYYTWWYDCLLEETDVMDCIWYRGAFLQIGYDHELESSNAFASCASAPRLYRFGDILLARIGTRNEKCRATASPGILPFPKNLLVLSYNLFNQESKMCSSCFS